MPKGLISRYIITRIFSLIGYIGGTMKAGLWIAAGICVGVGIMLLIGGFGDSGFGLISENGMEPAAVSFQRFGYDATMDIKVSSNGWLGLPLILLGLLTMIYCNATAWKDTNHEYYIFRFKSYTESKD